jgi:hypothetical protein
MAVRGVYRADSWRWHPGIQPSGPGPLIVYVKGEVVYFIAGEFKVQPPLECQFFASYTAKYFTGIGVPGFVG